VITRFGNSTTMYGLDLKNPSGSPVQLNQNGSPPVREGRHGWEWSTTHGAFIYWNGGADVYSVKLTGDWRTGNWTWSKLTTISNSLTPQDPSPGIYNRFRLARYGQTEYGVVVNSINGPVYAFRLPAATAAAMPNPPVMSSVQ
jgi:hypothetical protein